jgi:hypothetical protein
MLSAAGARDSRSVLRDQMGTSVAEANREGGRSYDERYERTTSAAYGQSYEEDGSIRQKKDQPT